MLGIQTLVDARAQRRVLAASAVLTAVVATLDWWTEPYVSLGFLYLFPIMLAAAFLPRWAVALLGLACAGLAETFSALPPSSTRLALEALALAGSGLFAGELIRARRFSAEAAQRLEALVETSPAAIVTVDERGFIELSNKAALDLLAPPSGKLVGVPVAAFLPELHHALRWENAPQFRASMECRCHKGNGEAFTAEVWFSTYLEGARPKLAAIIGDVTDVEGSAAQALDAPSRPLSSDRELDVLRLLVQGLSNKEIAGHLGVSESSVKHTFQQLFAKHGVRTRSQLVRVALEQHRNLL